MDEQEPVFNIKPGRIIPIPELPRVSGLWGQWLSRLAPWWRRRPTISMPFNEFPTMFPPGYAAMVREVFSENDNQLPQGDVSMDQTRTVEQVHKARLCQEFLHTQGWPEVVLTMVVNRVTELDRQAMHGDHAVQLRLEAIARKEELLALVKYVYKLAQEPNPFDTMRQALWSTLAPTVAVAPKSVDEEAEVILPKRRPSISGSVA